MWLEVFKVSPRADFLVDAPEFSPKLSSTSQAHRALPDTYETPPLTRQSAGKMADHVKNY